MDDVATANPETGAETGIEAAMLRMEAMEAEPEQELEEGQPEQEEVEDQVEIEASSDDDIEATGDEVEVEAEEPAPEEDKPAKYRVKVNGEEREVSLEDLQKGYMLESDYRQKTSAVSEQARAIEQRQAQLEAHLGGLLPQLEQQLQGQFSDIKTMADLQVLAKTDPARYVEYQAQQQVLASATQAQAQLRLQREQSEQANFQNWLQGEARTLAELVPAAADPETGAAYRKSVGEYAVSKGFPQERLAQMSALEFKVLDGARQWEAHQKAQGNTQAIAKKKVAKAPPVQKPGTTQGGNPKVEAIKSTHARLKKHGGVDNAVAALAARGL